MIETTTSIVQRLLNQTTHKIHTLPVLVLMPHSRCNCRCVMCDIWRANAAGQELSPALIAEHVAALRQFRVREIVLSGGEALMHRNLWEFCTQLEPLGAKITLLSTGLLLERHASAIGRWCHEVIVSLDGPPATHDRIRNVPRAYERLASGVAALREQAPHLRLTARSVIQRENFAELAGTIASAHELGLDQLSFLAVDVSSSAFNRLSGWEAERVAETALSRDECAQLAALVEQVIAEREADFASGFIAESPTKLRQIVAYFHALNGDHEFPPVQCNAPWVSAVIESDGSVRPCFFHQSFGNLNEQPLEKILNSSEAIEFRRNLDMARDETCRRCVCTLKLGLRQRL